jgi:hypothetical protein
MYPGSLSPSEDIPIALFKLFPYTKNAVPTCLGSSSLPFNLLQMGHHLFHNLVLEISLRYWTGGQWLTLVILAPQETEIRRIMVQSQPVQIVQKTLSQKKPITQKELVEWLKV